MKTSILAVVLIVVIGAASLFLYTRHKNNASNNTTNTTETLRSMSLSEVAEHASASDCWLVIDNKVYDVTNFIPQHPGGSEIVRGCGQDATDLFNTQGGRGDGHSGLAQSMLADLQIGVVN